MCIRDRCCLELINNEEKSTWTQDLRCTLMGMVVGEVERWEHKLMSLGAYGTGRAAIFVSDVLLLLLLLLLLFLDFSVIVGLLVGLLGLEISDMFRRVWSGVRASPELSLRRIGPSCGESKNILLDRFSLRETTLGGALTGEDLKVDVIMLRARFLLSRCDMTEPTRPY
eukprot:TRINITY_DN179_c0_g1_i4.p1 TRINITY_DN179_c0_g1~~TRINITY_DN179_c0_g1_i4.p1  ORF type:complete len:169 (-),score=11.64 TRINITY_DN179_c0_g1_i4:55-561(-)